MGVKETAMSMYDAPFLQRRDANYRALTPLTLIDRAATVYPDRIAVVYGPLRRTWEQLQGRCRALADAISKRGIGAGQTVCIMAPNVPTVVEAHFGVPMSGAVLCALNTRLDAAAIAHQLDHSECQLIFVDRALTATVKKALDLCTIAKPMVVDIEDAEYTGAGDAIGVMTYEQMLASGDSSAVPKPVGDEFGAIALGYTSGTTSRPKGCVTHHRGSFLQAIDTVVFWQMPRHAVFLWTSPMFHCNGWHFPWTIAAVAGTHVCLREVVPAKIFTAINEFKVTHLGGAPTVLTMLCNAAGKQPLHGPVNILTAGAPPPAAVVMDTEKLGFKVLQMYGLSETFGQVLVSEEKEEYAALPDEEHAKLKARQGVPVPLLGGDCIIGDADTCKELPSDGIAMGEILIRGNLVMKGYLKNEEETEKCFAGGWFHSGDVAVCNPDGFIQIKDRSKDVIISGGENISTVEVEEALYSHPAVMEAAVVAEPHPKWQEVPCAFVTLKAEFQPSDAISKEIVELCKSKLAKFKVPKRVVFAALPRNGAGKIQKFTLRDEARKMAAADEAKSKL